jgi:hypothetical protein
VLPALRSASTRERRVAPAGWNAYVFSTPILGCRAQAVQPLQAVPRGTIPLEAIMKKEIFEENKARWEVLEWMGSTQTKIIWGVAAVIVVLGLVYLLT